MWGVGRGFWEDEDGLCPATLTFFFPSPRALAGRCWSGRAGRRGWGWGAAILEWPKLWTTRVRTPDARGGWGKYPTLLGLSGLMQQVTGCKRNGV